MREKVTVKKAVWEDSSAAGGVENKNDWVVGFAWIFAPYITARGSYDVVYLVMQQCLSLSTVAVVKASGSVF